ncbi:MAG: hypothetical protein ABR961_04530 [Thermoanaerobaculaceae bacterium]
MTLAVVLAWSLVILVVTRARYGSDVRALIVVGARAQLPPAFASIPTAGPWGYDGQMYAALATDPFLRHFDTPHYLDTPWYRATRIMVPALAWILALGHAPAAIVAYQLLCWGFAIGAVYLIGRWLQDEGHSPWWALLAAGSGGTAAAILRTTPDGAALFFMLASLYLHSRGHRLPALALAVVAVLTRETAILAAVAMAVDDARRRRLASAAAFAGVPAAFGVGWQFHLKHVFGTAFDTGAGNFYLPFAWLPNKLALVFRGHHWWWMELFGTLAVLAATWALLVLASRPRTLDAPALTFVAFALLGVFLASAVYGEAWAYARALIALSPMAVLVAARESVRWRRFAVASVAVMYLLVGLTMVRGEVRDALGPRSLATALWQGTAEALPTAAARSGAPQRPAGLPSQPPLWVLPVANAGGRAGAVWQTHLAIENPHARSVRTTFELHLTASDRDNPDRKVVLLEPRQRLEWQDAVGEIFDKHGTGALKVSAEGGQVVVRSLTSNVSLAGTAVPLIPALGGEAIAHTNEIVRFDELAHDPNRDIGVRTNLGVFNLTEFPIRIRIEAFDDGYHSLGSFQRQLDPYRFTQVDDLFARFGAGRLEAGSAQVSALTRGASFIAYASVIRGANAPAVYSYPRPLPAPGSTR